MSRRHHGGRSHRPNGHARGAAPLASTQAWPNHASPVTPPEPPKPRPDVPAEAGPARDDTPAVSADGAVAMASTDHDHDPAPAERHDGPPVPSSMGPPSSAGCTAPQLRRFIKSRPYVPMHELRRRFAINGSEDDVTLVEVDGGQVFVGLPPREGSLLGELLRGGEVGYELSLDPRSPIVVGLYPMRPIPRN